MEIGLVAAAKILSRAPRNIDTRDLSADIFHALVIGRTEVCRQNVQRFFVVLAETLQPIGQALALRSDIFDRERLTL